MPRRKPDPTVLKAIGKRVAEARAALGLTQQELAQKAGIKADMTVSKIERGKQAPQEVLGGLCDALGRTADWILFEREDRRPHASLGSALRAARETAGYDIPRLSAALGKQRSVDVVHRWEMGVDKPSPEDITQIGAILGVDTEEIIQAACVADDHAWGMASVTNDEVRKVLEDANVNDGNQRFTFARFVSRWNLDVAQARAVLVAVGKLPPTSPRRLTSVR